MDANDLDGRIALVTGSTKGIGFRIAQALGKRGARVALNGRDSDAGKAALDRLGPDGTYIFEAGSAAQYDEIQRVVQAVEQRLGPLDILVCSGGTETAGPTLFHEMKPEDFTKAFEARYLPRVFPVHAALAGMRERQRGSIILVTTDAGRYPNPGASLNGAIGAATILTTKALAREFGRWKIRVNCIALTLTADTPRYDEIFSKPSFENRVFSKAQDRFPFGAAPTASEVARVAAFLASDEACQVSGQTISVNGGLSFGGW